MNTFFVCVVAGGGLMVAEAVYVAGSAQKTPATAVATKLPPSPAPQPSPPPADIPQDMPRTLAVQTADGVLIQPTPVDQKPLDKQPDGSVNPGDEPGVYIAEGVSTLPGTQQGTVIIGGHAKASRDVVFNPLMQLGEDDLGHAKVVLQMLQGNLVYTVEALYVVDKVDLPTQHALSDNRPGRLLLITCDIDDGRDTFQNLIVVACNAAHEGCSAT